MQKAMRKTYRDPEFFKEYTELTGLKAEPQMPEKLEQTIKDMPRDREAVELFKKLTVPDPLPQRSARQHLIPLHQHLALVQPTDRLYRRSALSAVSNNVMITPNCARCYFPTAKG
jgi:hypothetical protein